MINSNTCLIGNSKWQLKEGKEETIGEEIRAQDFPQLFKDYNPQVPGRINKRQTYLDTSQQNFKNKYQRK